MKMRISNYITGKLVEGGISQVFMVMGGGAMHLGDGLGHRKGLHCIYNHHEQACTMAAEAYTRTHNRTTTFCVTMDSRGTGTITGVVGERLDSIPMLVLSEQVRYDTTTRQSDVDIRAMGDQGLNIRRAIDCTTKYSKMVIGPVQIHYCLERTLYLTQPGRSGPCWLGTPLNIRGAFVEAEALPGFDPANYEAGGNGRVGENGGYRIPKDGAGKGEYRQVLPGKVDASTACIITDRIRAAKCPVISMGNGIRITGAHDVFMNVAEGLGVPVITGWDSKDIIYDTHPLYVGHAGNMGDRPGDFAVQNNDLVLSIGNRLSIRQVGCNFETQAREAHAIINGIDGEELKKPPICSDIRVHADAKDLLEQLNLALDHILAGEKGSLPGSVSRPGGEQMFSEGRSLSDMTWNRICAIWKGKCPVMLPKRLAHVDGGPANVYTFTRAVSNRLKEGQVTTVSSGSACMVGGHTCIIEKGQHLITNSAIASVGYGLPAVIGAWTTSKDEGCYCQDRDRSGGDLTLVAGDGSM